MRSFLTLTTAIILMLVFRALAFTVYTVGGSGIKPFLIHGDRVIVNRWSYGLRTGGGEIFRYERWIRQKPERGELMVFNSPMDTLRSIKSRMVCAGYFEAGAGDTVMMDGKPIVVPGKCRMIKVEPWNIKLLCNTYRMHECRKAEIKDNRLYVDGQERQYACFSNDYCWISNHGDNSITDSRYFGLVPESHVIGRVMMIAYSTDNNISVTGSLRKNRFMKLLPRKYLMTYKNGKEKKE